MGSRKRSHTTSSLNSSSKSKNSSNGKPKSNNEVQNKVVSSSNKSSNGLGNQSQSSNDYQPVEPYTVESLTSEIESMQLELQEAITAKVDQERIFAQEEKALLKALEERQVHRKSEETLRSQLRSENKALEDTRHNLETQKAKVDRTYKKLKDTITRKHQQMEKWQAEMEEADKNLQRSDNVIADLNKQYESDTADVKKNIGNLKKEVISIEKDVKKLNTEMKKVQSIRSATLEAIDEIKKKSDPNSGIVSDDVSKKVISQQNIYTSLKEALRREIQIENEIEAKWAEDQKELEKRYVVAYKQFQDSNSGYQRALDVYNEYVAPKASSIFSDSASFHNLAPTGSGVSMSSGFSPIHSLYPSTSNPTPGGNKNKRKNRSRRNTKSNGSNGSNNVIDSNQNQGYSGYDISMPINNFPSADTNNLVLSPSSGHINTFQPPTQSLSHRSSFSGLAPTSSSTGYQMGTNTGSNTPGLFATPSSNSLLVPGFQNSMLGGISQPNHSSPDIYANSMQIANAFFSPDSSHIGMNETNSAMPSSASSVSNVSPNKENIKLDTTLGEQFVGDGGGLQSPSDFVPSYIMKDDDGLPNSLSRTEVPTNNFGFSSDLTQSSVSLTAPSNNLSTSVSRPSAGMLARAMHQRTNSSDSLVSPRVSLGSSGLGPTIPRGADFDFSEPFPQDSHYSLRRRASFNHAFNQTNTINPALASSAASISSLKENASLTDPNILEPSHDDSLLPSHQLNQTSEGKGGGKGGSMFLSLFGSLRPKQSRKTSSSEQTGDGSDILSNQSMLYDSPSNTYQSSLSNSAAVGSRARSSSFHSVNSLPLSLGDSFGSLAFNPWNNMSIVSDMRATQFSSPNVSSSRSVTGFTGLEPSRSYTNRNANVETSPLTDGWDSLSRQGSGQQQKSPTDFETSSNNSGKVNNPKHSHNIWKEDSNTSSTSSNLESTEDESAPQPSQNKLRFSRHFSGLFGISGNKESSNEQYDDNNSNHSQQQSESLPNSFTDAPGKVVVHMESDGSLTTNSSSSSILNPPQASQLQPKGGLLQKGIRSLNLQRKVSSPNTSTFAEREGEYGLESDGHTNPPTSAGSKFAKRLSIFGKKDKDEDDRPNSRDKGSRHSSEDSREARVSTDGDNHDYHQLLDRMRK